MTSAPREPSGLRLLIVEDNADLRRVLLEILQFEGFSVECVSSGEEALVSLQANTETPHLILTDYLLEGMDGCALLQQLRAVPAWKRMPVVFLSGQLEGRDACGPDKLHPDAYVEKPFTIADLVQTIHSAIQNAQMGAEC